MQTRGCLLYTSILSISVEDPAPDMAKLIADKIATVSSDYIGDIMEMVPPKLIEEGERCV